MKWPEKMLACKGCGRPAYDSEGKPVGMVLVYTKVNGTLQWLGNYGPTKASELIKTGGWYDFHFACKP